MTRDEILEMPAGEVFALIKEKFGIEVKDENDLLGAWEVVEKMGAYELHSNGDQKTKHYAEFKWEYGKHNKYQMSASTAPLAICRAALLAVMT